VRVVGTMAGMNVGDGLAGPGKATTAGGVLCGLLTAGAIGAVLGSLDEYQVRDYADRDASIGLAGSLIAVVAAVVLIAVAGGIGARLFGFRRPQWHAPVPLVMVPVAVWPLVLGAERNRVEAGLIWGAAAVAVHAVLAYAVAGGRWRRWVAAGLVLPCALAGLATWGCQHRWRAQKFEAVGLPLVVPQVPGYRLTGTWAGRYSISMALRGPSSRRLYAVIEAASLHYGGCEPGSDPRRLMPSTGQNTQRAVFCLRDGAVLALIPGDDSAGIVDLPPGSTVREVDGSVMADYPDDATMSEPD
jgi:hypothetical protein